MKIPGLKTERLCLREIWKEDIDEIYNCWMQDEEVSRYMWWKASKDIEKTKEFAAYELSQLENERWNRWIIVLEETKEIIGTCLVFYNEEEDHWDISYNLGKKFWGKGYVTEAMCAVMKFAETELGMRECITSYAKVNKGSANVLHKLGFRDEKELPYEYCEGEKVTEGIWCRWISESIMR